MVISLNFFELMNLLSCFQVPTKYEKKLNIWFVHLQVIFDQSPTSEKRELENLFCRWILWNLNLKSKRVHLPRSWQKKPVYRPLGRNEERRGWAVFCHTERRKKSQRSQKAKRSSNQIKGLKENPVWMLKTWRSVLAAQWRKSKSLQHLVFPGGLPSKY